MYESLVLQPPKITEVEGNVVFLAGPIQGTYDWQSTAISIIHELDSGLVVASPRKDYLPGEFDYVPQVDWETHYLERAARAGVILFWLARQTHEIRQPDDEFPRCYAQTTRQEIAEWRTEKKHNQIINLVVGIESGFGNGRYIRHRFSQTCPNVPILNNLPDTCEAAVRLLT